MSELHDRYDRGAVTDRITQPPFAELAGRGRRRAYRTRTVRVAGVAMLAALVAAPLLTLQGGGSTRPAFPDGQFPPELENSIGRSMGAEFYDTRHGVATYSGDSCNQSWISVTRDGGVTWSDARELPQLSAQPLADLLDSDPWGDDLCYQPYVFPIAEETLVILATLRHQDPHQWVGPPTTAHISHDAGESWQEYEPEVRTVDTVPDGVIVGPHCEDEECDEAGVGWYDPESGDRMVLRDAPAIVLGYAPRHPTTAADGSIWVTESDGIGDFRVLVSRDRGRIWQDRSPDQLGNIQVGSTAYTTSDGETAYLWAPAYREPERSGALYRTTDGGETWQQLPAGQPFTAVENLRVARDGTLVVTETDTGTQYVSGDRGETFHATDQPLWGVRPLASGWHAFYPDDSNENLERYGYLSGYLSEDGLTWRPVWIPVP